MRGLVLLVFASCAEPPPAGQIALQIDTDAIVVPAPVPGLFDTLRVDVYAPREREPCATCSRTFTVSSTQFREGRVSFGIVPAPFVSGYRARAQLYASQSTTTGEPPSLGAAVIDVTLALPPVNEEGILERRVRLRTEDVGLPVGSLDEPIEPEIGRFERSSVNTWPGGRRVPCSGAPGAGEVCVPGGAFWMGNPRAPRATQLEDTSDRDLVATDATRVVVLSPFFVSAAAVTVGEFRAAKFRPSQINVPGDGSSLYNYCAFTRDPGGNEDHPVNCVTADVARNYCLAQGADLVTEAQMEYVAGALEGRLFVWGDDQNITCEDVVFGRSGYGAFANADASCRPETPFGGTAPVAIARRDKLVLSGGTLFDLIGNVSTWTADRFSSQDEPCWSHGGVYVDPRCDTGARVAVRGGNWHANNPVPAATRAPFQPGQAIPVIGIRCARPATP